MGVIAGGPVQANVRPRGPAPQVDHSLLIQPRHRQTEESTDNETTASVFFWVRVRVRRRQYNDLFRLQHHDRGGGGDNIQSRRGKRVGLNLDIGIGQMEAGGGAGGLKVLRSPLRVCQSHVDLNSRLRGMFSGSPLPPTHLPSFPMQGIAEKKGIAEAEDYTGTVEIDTDPSGITLPRVSECDYDLQFDDFDEDNDFILRSEDPSSNGNSSQGHTSYDSSFHGSDRGRDSDRDGDYNTKMTSTPSSNEMQHELGDRNDSREMMKRSKSFLEE